MLAVVVRNSENLSYVTEFLECWELKYVLSPIPGDQMFLGVIVSNMSDSRFGIRKEIYDALVQLILPFDPIDVKPLLLKAVS